MVRLLALTLALLVGAPGYAQESSPPRTPQTESRPTVRVTLENGDILTGELIDRNDEAVVINHPVAEIVTIPMDRVLQVVRISGASGETGPPDKSPPEAEPEPEADPGQEDEALAEDRPTPAPPTSPVPSPPSDPPPPAPKKPPAKWSGTVEAGLNGSAGNTDLRNARAAMSLRRESKEMVFDLSASYRFTERDGVQRQNRFFTQARNEWRLPNTNWRYIFVQGSLEVDRFRDYDTRVSGTVGFGYQFIDREKTSLIGRVGLGAAQEFGGSNGDLQPEAFAALEFNHDINDRLRLRSGAEIFPDLTKLDEFRARVNGTLEIDLDNHSKWRLRLGFEDRFETNTNRAEKNDFDYFATLVYTF